MSARSPCQSRNDKARHAGAEFTERLDDGWTRIPGPCLGGPHGQDPDEYRG